MSQSGTTEENSSSVTGTEYTDTTGSTEEGASAEQSAAPAPDSAKEAANQPSESEKEAGEKTEDEKKEPEKAPENPPPPPEPEKDPLEGITYEDDPSQPLPPYGTLEYWEQRYTADPEPFEWYQQPDALLQTFKKYVKPDGKVLVIGNGTSQVASSMATNGFEGVTAIDFSKTAVKKMHRRFKEIEGLTWKTMDVRQLTFPAKEFSSVVDKATLDCIFQLGDAEVLRAMSEISRVLKRRGVFICISCIAPEYLKKFFDRPADMMLELESVQELKKPLPSDKPHYVYIVRKVSKLQT